MAKRGEKELLNCTPDTDYGLQADLWVWFDSLPGKRGQDAQAGRILPFPIFGALDVETFNVQLA